MSGRWVRRAVTALAAACLALPALPSSADDVDPVRRVSCPTVEAVSAASGYELDSLSSSAGSCWYGSPAKGPRHRIEFTYTKDAALSDAKARVASWSSPSLKVTEAPALGEGAFAWSDGSGSNLYWEVSPGAVATLSGVGDDATAAKVAALFAPQMQVYTIPGEHTVAGRKWRTTCENYSATARCRTEIWASVIVPNGDGFSTSQGWQFNSLTYRWSDREMWGTNPLANSGTWTDSTGRHWRTECDTASTGRGACRSWFFGPTLDASASTPTVWQAWVFNNQVLFS